jgi:3-dehydroquinate synthase
LKTLNVDLGDRQYPVWVGQNVLPSAGAMLIRKGFKSAPIVVANRTVLRKQGESLLPSLRCAYGEMPVICIGDGEKYKNHSTLVDIYSGLFRAKADRSSWILAFGGGVVGDIAGFAAATFMRGIPFVMAPTTLLAQVDSSIGGKVAINVEQGKNLIGAFHQPSAVLSDTNTLKTLPKRELASGLYEVIKCGAIGSVSLLRYIERRLADILNCDAAALTHIVLESARIKAKVVAQDEKENNLRMILNYGHTVGHGLESATDYKKFKHGEAVGWGMIAAVGYGRRLGLLQSDEAARLINLIRRVGRLPSIQNIPLARLWSALARDKKFQAGGIRMVFLPKLGVAEIRTEVDSSGLQQFLRDFLAADGNIKM